MFASRRSARSPAVSRVTGWSSTQSRLPMSPENSRCKADLSYGARASGARRGRRLRLKDHAESADLIGHSVSLLDPGETEQVQ
jgi:hypothetical protein